MKKRTKIAIGIVCGLFLLGCGAGVLMLKKISSAGGIRYLYNLKHDTTGMAATEYHPENTEGADGRATCTTLTDPSVLGITETIRFTKSGETLVWNEDYAYMRPEPVFFEDELITGQVEGIFTFRGNYHRTATSYGTAQIENERFAEDFWSYDTGKLLKSSGTSYWSGNGWTGQPLIISWPEETKQVMNLYPEKKTKETFTEVIYSGMDG